MTDKEVQEKIAEKIKEANAALKEAQKLADENGTYFHWDGPAYGMGGGYQGKNWNSSNCEWETSDNEDSGWNASSQSC